MNTSHIDAAFAMLYEEFDRAIDAANQEGAAAFGRKDYKAVAALAEQGSRLARFQNKVAALEALWRGEPANGVEIQPKKEDESHSGERAEAPVKRQWQKDESPTPADFHAHCIRIMEERLGTTLSRMTRSAYSCEPASIRVVCLVSRLHRSPEAPFFWFSIHPYQTEFLAKYKDALVVLGCGSPDRIFAIPYRDFEPLYKKMNVSARGESFYHHIHIIGDSGLFYLLLKGRGERVEISKYLVK